MKKIILIGLTILIVPQIVFAAWWNPFSWFNGWSFGHKTDTETQILENRVKELEKKLDSMATSTTIVATSTGKTVSNTATTTATTTKIAVKTTIKPKTETSLNIKTEASKKVVKTFTLPSGAVIDDAGNIISPPTNTSKVQSSVSDIKVGLAVLPSEDIYTIISPSVALIIASKGNGSGFVINNGKYTLTNAHVVGNDQTVQLRFQNGTSFNGVVLGKNDAKDLALIFNGDQKPPAVTLGSSGDSLKIGTDVYAIGFPLSISEGLSTVTFTKGTLSARQNVNFYSGPLLQHGAPINHGNSGGPLVNNKGEVVGINTFSLNNEAQGIYFAIPIQTATDLIPTLSNYGQSRVEVYPIGSTQTIKKSVVLAIGLNEEMSCEQLGFLGNDLTMCNLYKNYHKDYQWVIKEDL